MVDVEKMRGVSISDVHLLAPRISTPRILASLRKLFSENALMQKTNTVIIAGDLWDRLIQLNNPDLPEVIQTLTYILKFSAAKGFTVIVLEGTRSHDWNQCDILVAINDSLEKKADLHYIKELDVVHFPRFDKNILFVPDDLHHDHDKIYNDVLNLLQEKNLKEVDMAIMHGMFEHQLPNNIQLPCHKIIDYESIVKDVIFIGHIHQMSQHGKINAQGSFARLNHGEEEAKGFFYFEYINDDHVEVTFIENKEAENFITVNVINDDVQTVVDKIRVVATKYNDDVTIRLLVNPDHPILTNLEEIYTIFPLVRFSEPKKQKDKEKEAKKQTLLETKIVPIQINRDNIGKLILERIEKRADLNELELELINNQINELR